MTPHKDYQTRIKAQGFNMSTWAKYVRISRSTAMRHVSGKIYPIPGVYIKTLEDLENGDLKNPNIDEG